MTFIFLKLAVVGHTNVGRPRCCARSRETSALVKSPIVPAPPRHVEGARLSVDGEALLSCTTRRA